MMNKFSLDLQHSNAKRVEYFLNQINQPLEQIPFDGKDWKHSEDIVAGFKLHSEKPLLMITVIFATSYSATNDIAGANSIAYDNYTVNGDVLFIVVSTDEVLRREVLSLFAGEE